MNLTFSNDAPEQFLSILRETEQWLESRDQKLWGMHNLTPENLITEDTEGNC